MLALRVNVVFGIVISPSLCCPRYIVLFRDAFAPRRLRAPETCVQECIGDMDGNTMITSWIVYMEGYDIHQLQ